MQVLATQLGGEATVRTLIKHVPAYVQLTADDQKQSETRPSEELWEQRVRNIKSHDKSPGNVIAEGFVRHVGKGRYRLSEAGWLHLKQTRIIRSDTRRVGKESDRTCK